MAPIPEYAILGHPNEGKSAVVSTLTEDDSVKVSPTPGETLVCRTFPVKIDGKEIIRFTDTPGFQRPGRTLRWMKDYSGQPKEMIGAFIAAHSDEPDFRNECELFLPIAEGAGIIFVVDGSRPIRNHDRMEMEILRLTGHPRMAVINCKDDDEDYLDGWKDAFRKSFNTIRIFNAHNADHRERIGLLESLRAIDQDWQPALDDVIATFRRDRVNRNQRIAEVICGMLEACLRHTVSKTYGDETEGRAAIPGLRDLYQAEVTDIEVDAHKRIRALCKHRIFQVSLPGRSLLDESLFARRTWQVLGLARHQLAGIAALSGGIVGAGIDIAAHGLTFGLFTAIGGAVGAGSAFVFGEQMARSEIVGLKLGGYRVHVGPNESMNFPYILLDRALLYYSLMIGWAHGRRDYPDSSQSVSEPDRGRAGFTASWSLAEKRSCQTFFRSIQKDDTFKAKQARESLVSLILRTLESLEATSGP